MTTADGEAASNIAFSLPRLTAKEAAYVRQSLESSQFSSDGLFSERCREWLQRELGSPAILTHSCTAALEISALLLDMSPGDEVILPSFTSPSTANAFALRGATPVFVDIRADTLNLDEQLLEAAVTPRTKAIVPVHYGGIACEMDAILSFAAAHGLAIVEDAAQAHLSFYKDRALGTMGVTGCLSFHVSKNLVCGEGGALIVNDPSLVERAVMIAEKGTNRSAYLNKTSDSYEWRELGSAYLPSDLEAAVLFAQFEEAAAITARRRAIWQRYHDRLADLEDGGLLARPHPPEGTASNGHIYFIILPSAERASRLRRTLSEHGIATAAHFLPLHSTSAGRRFGRASGSLPVAERIAHCLVRLPVHAQLSDREVDYVLDKVRAALRGHYSGVGNSTEANLEFGDPV